MKTQKTSTDAVTKKDAVNIAAEVVKPNTIDIATKVYDDVNSHLLSAVASIDKAIKVCKESSVIGDDRATRFNALNLKLEHSRMVNLEKRRIFIKNFDKIEKKAERDEAKAVKAIADFAKIKENYEKAVAAKKSLEATEVTS